MIKPTRLRLGDTVAVLSPSWGGPSRFPAVFELGVRNIEELLGLKVKEYPLAYNGHEAVSLGERLFAIPLGALLA